MAPRSGKYGRKEYPLTREYVRDWTMANALREFIANALDEEKNGHKAEFIFSAERNVLKIRNKGVTVSREAFLLGGTSKKDSTDTIGTYGEGMKIAFLVCAREGVPVTVKNGTDETWRISMHHSTAWNAEVLCLDVVPADRREPLFEVTVEHIGAESWELLQGMFLQLKTNIGTKVEQHSGVILRSPAEKGRLYVKGVLVRGDTGLSFGYAFDGATLNRDRKITEDMDLLVAAVWAEFARTSVEGVQEVYEMLDKGDAPESQYIRAYEAWSVRDVLLQEFIRRNGDAVIVGSVEEAAQVAHFGETAKAVGLHLLDSLRYADSARTFAVVRQKMLTTARTTYAVEDLNPEEAEAYKKAAAVYFSSVKESDPAKVTIVDFHGEPGLLGTYQGGNVSLSRLSLQKGWANALGTLVHEFAHAHGDDGSKGHVSAIENANERILNKLLDGASIELTIAAPVAPPQIIEKVVEKIVEKIVMVEAPVQHQMTVTIPKKGKAKEKTLEEILAGVAHLL